MEKAEIRSKATELFNQIITLPDWKQKAIFSYFFGLMKSDFTEFHLDRIEETIKIFEEAK